MYADLWLMGLGLVVGALGTLIGAGGGFVLVPILLILYPHESPETITSISLAVVFLNTFSGSAAYARMKRVDYRSGWRFAVATVPGAVLGAFATSYVPRRLFDGILGTLLIIASIYLVLRHAPSHTGDAPARGGHFVRRQVERDGTVHEYSFDLKLGLAISFFVGCLSGLLGIGGGIIHVPALIYLLNFPVHIATATSHFMLAIMALAATIVHIANGSFVHGLHRTLWIGIGVVGGAQLGALLSNRVRGSWIIKGLAIALGFVGIRILMMAF